jgi:hypothetical protein
MKRKHSNQDVTTVPGRTALKHACLAACRKVLERIARTKEMIFSESRGVLYAQDHLLRLALNEAEAAAWQTNYPDLVFPVLAAEKVRAVVAWDAKARIVRRARHAGWRAHLAKSRGQPQPRAGI